MSHCLANDCKDSCDPCESYICKPGKKAGYPVPGTDGKVCYGQLTIPSFTKTGSYLGGSSSSSDNYDSVPGAVPWVFTSDSTRVYATCDLLAGEISEWLTLEDTIYPFNVYGASISWHLYFDPQIGFDLTSFTCDLSASIIATHRQSHVASLVGRIKTIRLDMQEYPFPIPYAVRYFQFGEFNDLWGIPAEMLNQNTYIWKIALRAKVIEYSWSIPFEPGFPLRVQGIFEGTNLLLNQWHRTGALCLPPSRP